jgi:hypothetical protein
MQASSHSRKPQGLRILIEFILGVLNSRLVSYLYIRQVTQAVKDDFPQVTIKDLESLPFPSAASTAGVSEKLVDLVKQMLELKKQQARAPKKQSPSHKQLLDQKIAITDHQIDALVYELHGLTEEEIRIVGGKQK